MSEFQRKQEASDITLYETTDYSGSPTHDISTTEVFATTVLDLTGYFGADIDIFVKPDSSVVDGAVMEFKIYAARTGVSFLENGKDALILNDELVCSDTADEEMRFHDKRKESGLYLLSFKVPSSDSHAFAISVKVRRHKIESV